MRLLVSSLEPSANTHLEPILKELGSDVEIFGIFDKKFKKPLYDSSEFSVMGILDVIPKIFRAKRAIKEMVSLSEDVDKVLLIDSPAFNIPLARAIKESYPDKAVIYYILPKVWAWNKKRAKDVEKYCDRLCSIFPFEDRFFSGVEYVGNPILDSIEQKDFVKKEDQVAFLPGSRKSEIRALMPTFREVAQEMDASKVVVVPKFFDKDQLEDIYGDLKGFTISYDMHKSVARSKFAYVCSGTASLESTIIGTPFVLVYRARWLDYSIAKMFVKLKYVGLANILMDFSKQSSIHGELLQDSVNKNNLLKEYKKYSESKFKEGSYKIKEILKHGSLKNMVRIIYE
jgi:lipid-A-disaccharide synthase